MALIVAGVPARRARCASAAWPSLRDSSSTLPTRPSSPRRWPAGARWRILEVVKGAAPVGPLIAGPVEGTAGAAVRAGRPSLLLRHALSPRWFRVGTIGVEYAGWLRQLAATGPGPDRTDVDWRGRVALVSPYLEDPAPLVADFAYGEIARAPYGALRSLKTRLEPASIARWLDDPKLAGRRPAYTLLLGIAGGPPDAERLEQRLHAAWRSGDATNLGAMLAADLELRGPSRVAWIETMYLADRRRSMSEIDAAVQALSEHGQENGAVPRARVIQAYLLFIRERPSMADLRGPRPGRVGILGRRGRVRGAARIECAAGSRVARRDRRLSRTLPARRGQGRARVAAGPFAEIAMVDARAIVAPAASGGGGSGDGWASRSCSSC